MRIRLFFKKAQHQLVAEIVERACDRYPNGGVFAQFAHRVNAVVQFVENTVNVLQQQTARVAQLDPLPLAADEQGAAHAVFQPVQALAQRGLGDEQLLCGLRDAVQAGDLLKIAQLDQFQKDTSFFRGG